MPLTLLALSLLLSLLAAPPPPVHGDPPPLDPFPDDDDHDDWIPYPEYDDEDDIVQARGWVWDAQRECFWRVRNPAIVAAPVKRLHPRALCSSEYADVRRRGGGDESERSWLEWLLSKFVQ